MCLSDAPITLSLVATSTRPRKFDEPDPIVECSIVNDINY